MAIERIVPQQGEVVAAEPVAPVIAAAALLRRARGGFDLERVGAEAKVARAQIDFLAGLGRNDAGKEPAAAVQPIVETPAKRVDASVGVVVGESGEERFPRVGMAVAVGVGEIQHLGGVADEHAAAPGFHVGGEAQAVAESRRLVELAVAVAIDQAADAALRRKLGVDLCACSRASRPPTGYRRGRSRWPRDRARAARRRLARRQIVVRFHRRQRLGRRHWRHALRVAVGVESHGNLPLGFVDDLLLHPRRQPRGKGEVHNFVAAAVAAFAQQPFGRDVAAEVVRVAVEPHARPVEVVA